MKTITLSLITALFLITGCTREEVTPGTTNDLSSLRQAKSNLQMMEIHGFTPVCADSLMTPANLGETMSITRTVNLGSTTYLITGNSPHCSFNIKLKDFNGGNIIVGDSLRVTYCQMNICQTTYNIRTHAIPVISVDANVVTVEYGDCIFPLNGMSGHVKIKFRQ